VRPDGTQRKPVTIWVVRHGDELYVRAVNGRTSSWFRGAQASHEAHIEAGGVGKGRSPCRNGDLNDELDAAYRAKYHRYAERIVGTIVTSERESRPLASSCRV